MVVVNVQPLPSVLGASMPPVESFYSKLFLSEDQNSKLVLRITQEKEVRKAAASWTSEEFGNG